MDWSEPKCNLQNVDIVIGIIGSRIVDTGLIEKCIEASKHVVLFFMSFNDNRSYLSQDLENLEVFKVKVTNKVERIKYDSYGTFDRIFTGVLNNLI